MESLLKPAPDAVSKQVSLIVQVYLREALEAINAELGAAAARNNPQLVSAYVQACASIHSAKVIQEGWDEKAGTKR